MAPFGRILVAAGGSMDRALMDYVALLAAVCPSALFWVTQVAQDSRAPGAARSALHAEHALSDALRHPDLRTRLSLRSHVGDPLDVLLADAQALHADLVVVGTAGDRRRTLARRLAMKAPCSIWMVPPQTSSRLDRVLAAVDFSPRSADALGVATSVAAAAGVTRCDVLHVRFDETAAGFVEYDESTAERDEYDFALFVSRIDTHGVDLEPILRESVDLAGTIVRTADERRSDVIVMGTRGRSRASAAILGSETEHVLSVSPVPVLAVKHFGTQLRLLDALRDRPSRRGSDLKFA